MVNRSDRRLQILIYPAAAVRSQKADEEQARKFPSWLVRKNAHSEAECTDAIVTLNQQPILLIGGSPCTDIELQPILSQSEHTKKPAQTGDVHIVSMAFARGIFVEP